MLKNLDNFIGTFRQKYPNLYAIIKFIWIKRGLAGKLISLAGIALSPNIIAIFIFYFLGDKNASNIFQIQTESIIFAICLVFLAICIYWTDNSTKKTLQETVENSISENVIRIVDKKISTRIPLLCTLAVMFLLSLLLATLVIPLIWHAPKFTNTHIALIFLFFRTCFFILSLFLPIFIFSLFWTILFIKNRKVIFLPFSKNLLIEYGQDSCLYLTRYEFICPNCKGVMRLNRTNGFILQCNEYEEHKLNIDPVKFTKYSIPNLSREK